MNFVPQSMEGFLQAICQHKDKFSNSAFGGKTYLYHFRKK